MEASKMKKVTIKAPEPKPEAEKAKRIYRAALEIIKTHDSIYKQKKAYRDVFMPEAIMLRDRLQEYCEKLLFYCPLEYGRKSEELLWRKVFYEIIQLMKHNRKHMLPSSSLESAFRTHLASAVGYYHHLLCRLQSEYDLSMEFVVDFYYLPESKTHRKPHHSSKVEPVPEAQRWALECCHRCLIYLGDLARYQFDYAGLPSRNESQRYYCQAFTLCPELGMPHNQLGTLAGTSYYGLDAAYYYLRCVVSPTQFDGAHGNLVRLFERNRRRYQELGQLSQRGLLPEQQRSKDVKRFVIRLLHLVDMFYTKSRQNGDMKTIQDVCQSTLHDFNLCMFSQPSEHASRAVTDGSSSDVHSSADGLSSSANHSSDDERPSYLSDEIVFKIIVVCLAMIHIMQKDNNKLVAAAIAFSLALFSHVLNHVTMRLQSALYDLENPRKVLQVPSSDELDASADADDVVENSAARVKRKTSLKKKAHHPVTRHDSGRDPNKSNDDLNERKKSRKKHVMVRRRRRKCNDSEGSEDSDLSEGDLTASDSDNDRMNGALSNSSGESSGCLSESDSDDALMVSQELKPGFSEGKGLMGISDVGKTLKDIDEENFDRHSSSADLVENGSCSSNASDGLVQDKNAGVEQLSLGMRGDMMPDVAEYLREIPLDWLSDAANLLSKTLRFGVALANDSMDSGEKSSGDSSDGPSRVPPGFEKSAELHHVMEISEKLANFEIETDTDLSACPTDTENSTVTESEMDTEVETDKESVVDRSENDLKRLERVVELATKMSLLCSVKVYCDWMLVNPHIIATCAKISSSLWYRLSVLLNFLPAEIDLARLSVFDGVSQLNRLLQSTIQLLPGDAVDIDCHSFEKITVPLTEDLHLQKFPPLQAAHKDLVVATSSGRIELSSKQEAMLRVCCLRRFGYIISVMKSVSFTYDPSRVMFCGPQQVLASDTAADERQAENKLVSAEARRNQLMRDMAQLRLRAEVNQLEGSLQKSSPVTTQVTDKTVSADNAVATSADLPPYLVPDALTLCESLNLVKQLAASSRFIVIIPLAVIDHLDLLKKDNAGAREAIRWLESEFQKGSRYVRAQKQHEKTPLSVHLNVKKDKEAVRFLQIFECCRYLGQQRSTGDNELSKSDLQTMVCLLTRLRVATASLSIRTKELIADAQFQGLTLQSAPDFHARWRELWKNEKG